MIEGLQPLDVKISRCSINGQMYSLVDYEEYAQQKAYRSSTLAVTEEINGTKVILPYRGKMSGQPTTPGIYDAGCIDFCVYPDPDNMGQYVPNEIIEMSNKTAIKTILERKKVMDRLDEPWITSPDNITKFPINENDQPEMVGLKTALNEKEIDFDKYAPRFGDNFPNDKRQLKNTSVTLNIIKRFCDKCDMEAVLTLKDKNPNVPNPIGREITVSLTEAFSGEDEED